MAPCLFGPNTLGENMSQDPNIQHELIELRGAVQAMKEQGATTRDQIADLARDVRGVLTELSRLASTAEGITRLQVQVDKAGQDQAALNKEVAQALAGMNQRFGRWVGGLSVATFMMGAMLALIAYIYDGDKTRTDRELSNAREAQQRLDERMDRIEIWAAGDRDRPYKR